jgi:hypothetical protein
MDQIQTGLKKRVTFSVKVGYKNGANETVFSVKPPNILPGTALMTFVIKDGCEIIVNLQEVRRIQVDTQQEYESEIIV